MTYPTRLLVSTLTVLSMALASSAWASSTTAGSSASSAGSMSLQGSSASIEGSSGVVSSGGKDKTALVHDGDYRVAAIEPASDAPDTLRLTLAPHNMADPQAQTFVLRVPTAAFEHAPPQTGELLQAQHRDYGLQFTRDQKAFLLVLADAWQADLNSRPVTP